MLYSSLSGELSGLVSDLPFFVWLCLPNRYYPSLGSGVFLGFEVLYSYYRRLRVRECERFDII